MHRRERCCCAAWNELRGNLWNELRGNLNFDRTTSQGRVDYILAFGTGRRFVSCPNRFLAFRATLFVLMLAVLCWSVSEAAIRNMTRFWLIYFTHWTLLFEVVYLGCALYTTAALRIPALERIAGTLPPTPGSSAGMPRHVKATCVLRAVVLPASFLVFALYWLLVFPYRPSSVGALSVFVHGVNFLVMLLDGWLSRQPHLISHVVYFLAYVVLYVCWTIIHAVANIKREDEKEYIYAALDWRHKTLEAAIYMVAVVTIAVPLVHLFFWWLLQYQPRHLDFQENADGRFLNADEENGARGSDVELTALPPGQSRDLGVNSIPAVGLSVPNS